MARDYYEAVDPDRGYQASIVSDDAEEVRSFRDWLDAQAIPYEAGIGEGGEVEDTETGWIEGAAKAVLLKITWGADAINVSGWQKHYKMALKESLPKARALGVDAELLNKGSGPYPVGIQLSGPGGERFVPLASSPQDAQNTANKARQAVVRLCKEICDPEYLA